MYRHGDLLLVQVDRLPDGAAEVERPGQEEVVLAYGEATGHAHRAVGTALQLWQHNGQRYLLVGEGAATLVHEEHAPIVLPAGTYHVLQQRVYTPEEARNVVD